jgi:hypothetical protein
VLPLREVYIIIQLLESRREFIEGIKIIKFHIIRKNIELLKE